MFHITVARPISPTLRVLWGRSLIGYFITNWLCQCISSQLTKTRKPLLCRDRIHPLSWSFSYQLQLVLTSSSLAGHLSATSFNFLWAQNGTQHHTASNPFHTNSSLLLRRLPRNHMFVGFYGLLPYRNGLPIYFFPILVNFEFEVFLTLCDLLSPSSPS